MTARERALAAHWGPMCRDDMRAQYQIMFSERGAVSHPLPQCALAVGDGAAERAARKALVMAMGYPPSIRFRSPHHALVSFRKAVDLCPNPAGRAVLRLNGEALGDVCKLKSGA